MHDLACVVHLHSTYSDGTGTVPEIARAARRAGADVVLLTDHDTLEAKDRGEEGWYGKVLLLAGVEVSPRRRNHYLAFGLDRAIDHDGLDAAGICRAVQAAGGFGFAAHPFSRGSQRFSERAPGMPFEDLECEALHGIELWSFVNDTGEAVGGVADILRFVAMPGRVLDHPPERNLRVWDELCRHPPCGRDRRPRRSPVRQAHRAVRAAPGDGLPALVSLHPHARAVRRGAQRRARSRPRAGLRRPARRALLHRRRLGGPGEGVPVRG